MESISIDELKKILDNAEDKILKEIETIEAHGVIVGCIRLESCDKVGYRYLTTTIDVKI